MSCFLLRKSTSIYIYNAAKAAMAATNKLPEPAAKPAAPEPGVTCAGVDEVAGIKVPLLALEVAAVVVAAEMLAFEDEDTVVEAAVVEEAVVEAVVELAVVDTGDEEALEEPELADEDPAVEDPPPARTEEQAALAALRTSIWLLVRGLGY
jgi:hypothetical protein